ncbi:JAB1/Mov34/MPN/PAD-1 ubiquitin protease-domain-containing protein, partial [Mucidula mucida]
MLLEASSSAIHIHAPTTSVIQNTPRTPTNVTIHPVALFSILDHYLRRTEKQARVLGTLLGTRNDSEVQVRSSFAVLHSETSEQVAVDMDYHRAMYDLHHKVNPKEVIVGWYSTGANLNTLSALIQNFYSQETAPHQAIHVALNTGVDGSEPAGVKAYFSSPVGVFPRPGKLRLCPGTVDLLKSTSTCPNASSSQPVADLEIIEGAIKTVTDMLDRVLTYVP